MHRLTLIVATAWILAVCVPAVAQDDCVGLGDLDADGLVASGDFAALEPCLSGPGGGAGPGCDPAVFARGDQDADDDLDVRDFAAWAPHFGAAYFAYGPHRDNEEAELLAMQLRGTLRAADGDYERVLNDLGLIRAAHAELVGVIDDPDWVPNQLIVKLHDGEPDGGYQALNAYYLLVDEEVHSWGRVLTFCDNLNPAVLAAEYAALPEVQWAEPNYWFGTDDQITVVDLGDAFRYSIDDGFLDCFDGCDCHRDWVLDVSTGGTVTLVSYEEWGMPWCEF